jgi:hypothetical protein
MSDAYRVGLAKHPLRSARPGAHVCLLYHRACYPCVLHWQVSPEPGFFWKHYILSAGSPRR